MCVYRNNSYPENDFDQLLAVYQQELNGFAESIPPHYGLCIYVRDVDVDDGAFIDSDKHRQTYEQVSDTVISITGASLVSQVDKLLKSHPHEKILLYIG
ncbi:MAG: hypothetical protein H6765_00230 [Candidatus Peribacteria bacterium]|nr:MAG: hypothetical protein H6765_00230 [Candidatus Peribacteria bacterium]